MPIFIFTGRVVRESNDNHPPALEFASPCAPFAPGICFPFNQVPEEMAGVFVTA
jgi:hypothetical protein